MPFIELITKVLSHDVSSGSSAIVMLPSFLMMGEIFGELTKRLAGE